MDIRAYQTVLPQLDSLGTSVRSSRAVLGFDGTVDVICRPVEARHGNGDHFDAFATMKAFGQRVVDADGKSAIVELVEQQRKIGGNGPIMANALATSGMQVDYVGCTDDPTYDDFTKHITAHPLSGPAVTHALEFPNGKLMLGEMTPYQSMDADTLRRKVGVEPMAELIGRSSLVGLLNWACCPGFGSMLGWVLDEVLPTLPADPSRVFFFDLADPSMRSPEEFASILQTIARFQDHGQAALGMNLNETQQVARVLGVDEPAEDAESLQAALPAIRGKLGIGNVICHGTALAACATPDDCRAVNGPYTPNPKITTGAGDHFNAGFCLGRVAGLDTAGALTMGVLYSGFYVRHARPPEVADLPGFIEALATEP